MRLPEFSDPRRVWQFGFIVVYLVFACVLGGVWGTKTFLVTMMIGSLVDVAWELRLSLKRWN